MLLGMYRCTDIPGKFVWQPGSLTQAVSNGHWILLEDIDHAPLDVVSSGAGPRKKISEVEMVEIVVELEKIDEVKELKKVEKVSKYVKVLSPPGHLKAEGLS